MDRDTTNTKAGTTASSNSSTTASINSNNSRGITSSRLDPETKQVAGITAAITDLVAVATLEVSTGGASRL